MLSSSSEASRRQRVAFVVSAVSVIAAVAAYVASKNKKKRKIVITGACGNLGTKLALHLISKGYEVVGIEHPKFLKPRPYQILAHDVATPGIEALSLVLQEADACVHFSAVNPYPNATWAEAALSISHAVNILLACQKYRVRRVLIASSNHVYGGYKDDVAHGVVRPSDPPKCGTLLLNPDHVKKSGDAVAYAAAKLAAEQVARGIACKATSVVVLRVGWCQPGENSPKTLSAAGVPPQYQTQDTGEADTALETHKQNTDELWFKHMWLSNDDFLSYFTAALEVDADRLKNYPPTVASVSSDDADAASDAFRTPYFAAVNAMSNNTGMRWSLEETVALLGVHAKDDSMRPLM